MRYQPFYCEENVWQLLAAQDDPSGWYALVIANAAGSVAVWHQRQARAPDEPMVWDYHVVAAQAGAPWLIWDAECVLGMPLAANLWIGATFQHQQRIPPRFRPAFRIVRAADYASALSTDRSHMRDAAGHYVRPPPPWPAPFSGVMTLPRLVDLDDDWVGDVLDLPSLRARMVASGPS